MINKNKLIDKKQAPSVIQRFTQPASRYLVLLVVMMTGAIGLLDGIDPTEWVVLSLGVSGILLLSLLLISGQRVEIDGTTVTIANMDTFHRKRTFTVNDVTELHIEYGSGGGAGIALVGTLRASAARKWVSVRINSVSLSRSDASVDSPVFLAFVAAVNKAHPAMKVSDLPHGYGGQMPRA